MELDPGRNKDFVCCCKTMREVMAYFPITAHEKMNGVYGIYEYSGNLIQQRDSISEYVTADANKLKIIDMLSFDEAYKMG
ncbi:MAG: hypothetical protein LBK62_12355 [Treponema sp.]|nr:hypothetical protein [Treponema sp.]